MYQSTQRIEGIRREREEAIAHTQTLLFHSVQSAPQATDRASEPAAAQIHPAAYDRVELGVHEESSPSTYAPSAELQPAIPSLLYDPSIKAAGDYALIHSVSQKLSAIEQGDILAKKIEELELYQPAGRSFRMSPSGLTDIT